MWKGRIIGEDLLAAVFEVGKVYVGKAVYDSAVDGATESLTAIWGSNALLAHLNPAGGMKKLTAAGILEIGGKYKVKKWRVEELSGDAIEVSTMYVPKLVATNCAYYFSAFATT